MQIWQVKGIHIGKKESSIHYDMIVYTENPKESKKKPLGKISEYRKFAGHTSEYKNQMHFCKLAMNKWKHLKSYSQQS